MRKFFGPAGSVIRTTVESEFLQSNMLGDPTARTVVPECLESFMDLVLPVLQERGAYKREYAPGTYRQKLFGHGDRLPSEHPAAAARWSVDRKQ